MSEAWIHLRAMAFNKTASESNSLTEELQNYHEWYRLTDTDRSSDRYDVATVARGSRLAIVVGGPGSGKSTFLRWLAHHWSLEGKVVLKVSLQAIKLRMEKMGETFDEAILSVAIENYSSFTDSLRALLRDAPYLLADGLDETDPNRSVIADQLQKWTFADTNRRVIVTTRPVGHVASWFDNWEHYELLPLDQSNIEQFSQTVFSVLYPASPELAGQKSKAFSNEIARSRTASVAARNPQLLGFLIALYTKGDNIGGNRYQLFAKVVDEIRKETIRDRSLRYDIEEPFSYARGVA